MSMTWSTRMMRPSKKPLQSCLQSRVKIPPREVLVHDNGKDFIQFFAVFGKEITTGRPTESCHLQYCEYREGKPSCFFNEEADFNQIVRIFQVYAKKLHWKGKVAWEPLKKERSTGNIVPGIVLTLAGITGFCLGINGVHFQDRGVAATSFFVLLCFGIAGLCFWREFISQGGYGAPWISGEGSCTSGGCGGDGGGDGGGGCGGGDGGGCGGGGE